MSRIPRVENLSVTVVMKMEQGSCNTFVVLPPITGKGSVIFGKNSDRPSGEVQELIYEPPKECTAGKPLKCTYIEVKQVDKTYGVILSKPAWMWGCEMGANDQGVVIGNEAIWTKVEDSNEKRLLGMDLVRLALERSKSAEEALDVITQLLSEYGQGGPCSDTNPQFTYHNSFLIADANEAWVLETAGKCWVAQKITSGYRNISNCLTIETQYDKSSPDLISFAKEKGFWDGEGDFNFAHVYSDNNSGSLNKNAAGQELLKKYTESNNFNVKDMFAILRNKESGICCGLDSNFPTTASQVSMLSKSKPCCHWFTATPDPTISVFKPFIFTPDVRISSYTKSPEGDPKDRRHVLYSLHESTTSESKNKVTSLLQDMEKNCLEEVEKFLDDYQEGQSLSEVDELLKDVVETEVKFYK